MNIVAIGRTRNLYDAILALKEKGHNITAIITSKAAPEYDINEHDFCDLAEKIGCEFQDLSHKEQILYETLSSMKEADMAISVNWVSVITTKIINRFRIGILNAHFGDLPNYRGNACPNWALLSGEKDVFLSVHLMEGGQLDCGRVIAQARQSITGTTTIGEIYNWSKETIPMLFCRSTELLEQDPHYQVKFASCDGSDGFRCYPRTPEDSFIQWEASAVEVDRLIRASSHPFSGAYTYIVEEGLLKRLYILKSRVHLENTNDKGAPGRVLLNDRDSGCTHVMCGQGVLEISQCRIDDGEIFEPGKYFRSIRIKFGKRIEDYIWEKQHGVGIF
ncbi:methionyl-tRNA formyltransferase [Salidesulfovibrio onnuriiensis]|uniref:methionyl-tRNA formyltransferase n=1 Tax=Salidesulfovibrio onnuriiensis TaxID=2583823 RepID=UPI0011C747FC|nr:formyltransferase family protein [Salidesulfovibrio onnuriiensis]